MPLESMMGDYDTMVRKSPKRNKPRLTLREIMLKHVIQIGGGYLISAADYPEFIRALHKWSRDRYAK